MLIISHWRHREEAYTTTNRRRSNDSRRRTRSFPKVSRIVSSSRTTRCASPSTTFFRFARSSTSLLYSVRIFGRFSSPQLLVLTISNLEDYHHDWIFPSSQPLSDLMPRILATWTRKGIKPKFHLSEPRRGAVTLMVRSKSSFLPRLFSDLTSSSSNRNVERTQIVVRTYRARYRQTSVGFHSSSPRSMPRRSPECFTIV